MTTNLLELPEDIIGLIFEKMPILSRHEAKIEFACCNKLANSISKIIDDKITVNDLNACDNIEDFENIYVSVMQKSEIKVNEVFADFFLKKKNDLSLLIKIFLFVLTECVVPHFVPIVSNQNKKTYSMVVHEGGGFFSKKYVSENKGLCGSYGELNHHLIKEFAYCQENKISTEDINKSVKFYMSLSDITHKIYFHYEYRCADLVAAEYANIVKKGEFTLDDCVLSHEKKRVCLSPEFLESKISGTFACDIELVFMRIMFKKF